MRSRIDGDARYKNFVHQILPLVEEGKVEFKGQLAFHRDDDRLLIGFDGENFVVKFEGRTFSLPPRDLLSSIKNKDRKIMLRMLKEREESKEKSKVELLVSLTEEDCTFFTDEHGEGYVALNIGDGYKVMRIRSREFKDYLCLLLYQRGGKSPSTETINVALNLLEGKAKFDGKRIPLSVRVASKDGKIFYDLCHPDWKIVEITSDGWRIVPHSSIVFKRYPHQQPQVNPPQVGPEEFKRLEKYSPLEEGDRLIFLVHIASYLIPDFPHPIGALYGPHGSGKTTLLRLIRKLIDPSSVGILSLPHDPRETIQLLAHHYFAPFDNVSRLNEWQSNMLCRAVTGEGQSKRELYTDDDDVIYSFRRCLALNGINLTADNPDLMDRVIPYRLERIPRTERKSEKKIIEQFEQDLPYILGGLFSVISKALKIYPEVEKDLDGEELPRMADFTLWGEAIARALGYPPLEFRDQYLKKIRSINKETLEAHVIGDLILKLVEREKNTKEKKKTEDGKIIIWDGTPTELYNDIEMLAVSYKIDTKGKGFPKAPHSLMRKLNEIETNLQDEGIFLRKERDKDKRIVKICVDEKREKEEQQTEGEGNKKIKKKSVKSVKASPIRRKTDDAIGDATLGGEIKASSKSVINSTGGDDAMTQMTLFSGNSFIPTPDLASLNDILFSIIPKEPRSITIDEISQRLKEKNQQIDDVEKLRKTLMGLCEQGLIRAIDPDFSSFTKPREEKKPKNGEKTLEKEEKKRENPGNGVNKEFLTSEELDLVRKAERIVGDGRLCLAELTKALGGDSIKKRIQIQNILYKAMSRPKTTILRQDGSYFYLDFGNKKFELLALNDFEAYDEGSQKPVKARKGEVFSAGPRLTRYLFGRGLVEIISWEENKSGG